MLDTGADNDGTDQCAHGGVVFTIDAIPFVGGSDAEGVTVSAAALFLLRTLTHDHTAARPVAESSQLFPCCGHTAYPNDGRFPVLVLGCNVGIDVDVMHFTGTVTCAARTGRKQWSLRRNGAMQWSALSMQCRRSTTRHPHDSHWATTSKTKAGARFGTNGANVGLRRRTGVHTVTN